MTWTYLNVLKGVYGQIQTRSVQKKKVLFNFSLYANKMLLIKSLSFNDGYCVSHILVESIRAEKFHNTGLDKCFPDCSSDMRNKKTDTSILIEDQINCGKKGAV